MATNNTPYAILVGVGTLYVAAASTAAPAVNATPGAGWTSLGNTDGGVKVNKPRSLEFHKTDQSTAPVKATINEEGLSIECNLVDASLETVATLLALTVTDTPPGSGTIGTRKVGLRAGDVSEKALLFRGTSPYGNWNAQFYVPRGVFDGDLNQEFKKTGKVLIPLKFVALEDPNTATDSEKLGVYTAEDAAAL
jgi:hypothetical protein